MSEKYEILKTINDLARYHFVVPSYQRGYRWGEKEIRELLEDIWDFAEAGKHEQNSESFYCLQPIVVRSVEGEWDEDAERRFDENSCSLIDGQQRLTTIFLILKFLGGDNGEDYFSLKYKTRKDSGEFLSHINIKELKDIDNMDFYHFYKAYGLIKAFFGDSGVCLGEANREKFKITLLQSCRVLWHEIKEDNEEKVFTRLNIGKIPLLPAENIKALFLVKNEKLKASDLEKRARIWYESEVRAREENDFRYMVLNKIESKDIARDGAEGDEGEPKRPSLRDDIMRIEVYLRAISDSAKDLFGYFYEAYRAGELSSVWEELEECINTFEGFAFRGGSRTDREIFHYLGFLILSGEGIGELYKMWKKEAQESERFRDLLFGKIKKKMFESIESMEKLKYFDDKSELIKILLLFNLEYLITQESSNEYFKFNRFQLEEWSLEHVYAQNSKSIKTAIEKEVKVLLQETLKSQKGNEVLAKKIKAFLKDIDFDNLSSGIAGLCGEDSQSLVGEIEGKVAHRLQEWFEEVLLHMEASKDELSERIKKAIKKKKIDEKLFDAIDEAFRDDNFQFQNIGNLTLLDRSSNSKIGNLIFSKKRQKIEELGRGEKLIPVATRKVFNKEFSSQKSNPDIFTKQDREDYQDAIKKLLRKFTKEA